ncbi:hypothetical protein BH09BAC1_BH09BAC1_06250 [soil metagenome]
MYFWKRYKNSIFTNCSSSVAQLNGLPYWQNKLFATILIYLLPLSLLVAIPSIVLSIASGIPVLAVVDVIAVALILVAAFAPSMSINIRKILLIAVLHVVAVALLFFLGSFGPGLIYLYACTVFIILIFPTRVAYLSVVFNTLVCVLFGVFIHFGWVSHGVIPIYSVVAWAVVSINLIILCSLTVILLPMLFNGLQATILDQLELKAELVAKQVAMEHNETRFRALVEHSQDMLTLFSADLTMQYISPAVEKKFGYTNEENRTRNGTEVVHPEDAAIAEAVFKKVFENPLETFSAVIRNRKKDGSYIWVEGDITNMLHVPGVNAIVANFRDITTRKQLEDDLLSANRLYKFISQINQTIVHTTDEATLFKKACEIAIEFGHYQMAWISILDSGADTINLLAECGVKETDHQLLHVLLTESNFTEKVRETGNALIINDIASAEGPEFWKDYFLKRGCKSAAILPLVKGRHVTVTFCLFSDLPGAFNQQEMTLLDEVMGDISFALDTIESSKQKTLAENRLAKSEQQLSKAQQIAAIGSWEMNLATYEITWSDEMFRIFELEVGELIPDTDTYYSFIHPEEVDSMKEGFVQLQQDFQRVALQHRIVLRNGHIKYVYTEGKFEFDSEGKPLYLYGIMHDVTQTVLAEQQLVKNEKFLMAIIDNSADGILLINENMEAIYVSPNSKRILGHHPEQLLGNAWRDWVHPEDKKPMEEMYIAAIQNSNHVRSIEYRFRKNDDTYIWLEVSYSNYLDERDIHAVIINYRDITARKAAQERMQQADANLRLILDAVPLLVFAKDREGRFIFANKQFCELYGLEMDMLLSQEIANIIPIKRENKQFADEDLKVIETGEPLMIPSHTFTDSKGVSHIFQTTKMPFIPAGSTDVAVLGVAVDITDIINAQENLRQSEARNRGILDSQTSYVIRTDLEGNYSYCNNKFFSDFSWVYGTGIEDVIGKNSILSIMEYHHYRVMGVVEQCFGSLNEVFQVELDKPKKGGGIVTTLWDFICLTDATGQPTEMQCVGIDISGRKIAEDALKESAYLLEKAQQVAHIGHWVVLTKTGHITWSDETYRIFGLDKDTTTLDIDLFFSYVHPDDLEMVREAYSQAIDSSDKYDIEHRIVRPDGSVRWVREQAEISHEGEETTMIGICKDITDRKAAQEKIVESEAALRIMNSELEERVLARTAALLDANIELEAFSYTVSHDLRTPIRAIQIFGGLLEKQFVEMEDRTAATYLENVMKCTVEMKELISDLLAFSKLGRHELAKEMVDMDSMVKDVANHVLSTSDNQNATITFDDLLPIAADDTLLRSVWMNLISNAVKYHKKEVATIITIASMREGNMVVYSVKDNGIGFDMQYYDKLFRPFSRLHTATAYKGTGAGLAICQRIIKKHGGKIWAEAVENGGSTFFFSLPIN